MNKYFFLLLALAIQIGWDAVPCYAITREIANVQLFENIDTLNYDGVKQALDNNADPNYERATIQCKLPIEALMLQDIDPTQQEIVFKTAILLINHGAKITDKLLFFPISSGDEKLAKFLIDNGASPVMPIDGKTPMELANYYKHEKIVALLAGYGVPKLDSAVTAQIDLVKASGDHNLQSISAAINAGANVNGVDSTGMTPLIAALRCPISQKEAASIKFLLSHGANPNLTGNSGFSGLDGIPIHIIVAMNSITMNKSKADGQAAEEVLLEMLKYGAKVSAIDSVGQTPLHIAAKHDNLVAAKILLKSGCRVMPTDIYGKTPLDYAESAAMIKFLKQNGARESISVKK